ncbi:MAG TPA: sulfotransferase [Solimonas sp.]
MTTMNREQTLLAQAKAALQQQKIPEAVQHLQAVLKEFPGSVSAHTQLGALLARAGQRKAAEAHLAQVVRLAPGNVQSWRNLVTFYITGRRWKAANEALRRFIAQHPGDEIGLRQLLLVQKETRAHAAALATADRLVAQGLSDPDLLLHRAELLSHLKRDAEALSLYDTLLTHDEVPMVRFEGWVRLACRFERGAEVAQWCRRRLAQSFSTQGALMLCAALLPDGLYDEALKALEAAYELEPNNVRVLHDLGVVLRFLGRVDEARRYLDLALQREPGHVSALRVFGTEHKYEYGDAAFNRLQKAAAQLANYAPSARVQLHYAMGKAFDDVGDIATAFAHYVEGGRVHLRDQVQDDNEQKLMAAQRRFTAPVLRQPAEPGCDSELPVFVLGMPRSGTSLVEQVLASHPAVYGAGELKLMPRVVDGIVAAGFRLALQTRAPVFAPDQPASWKQRGDAYVDLMKALVPATQQPRRIVDKMPGNYVWVGQIHLMMPKARIVHCRRHPVETCLSAFRLFFPDGQYWSYDLRKMGQHYRRYLDLMQHWRETLPAQRMLEVRYEDMVAQLEPEARRLIAHCGLDWDPACLSFHETERAVRTASAAQVRKPIYQSSMNRWRKYEPYLGPLLKELGSTVQAYEDELSAAGTR